MTDRDFGGGFCMWLGLCRFQVFFSDGFSNAPNNDTTSTLFPSCDIVRECANT